MAQPLSSIKRGLEPIRIGSRLDLLLDNPEPFYPNIRNRNILAFILYFEIYIGKPPLMRYSNQTTFKFLKAF